jgi:hypothetical protein
VDFGKFALIDFDPFDRGVDGIPPLFGGAIFYLFDDAIKAVE